MEEFILQYSYYSPYPAAVMRKCLLCLVVAVTGKVGMKGKVSRDFCLQVFDWSSSPEPLIILIGGISNFVKNSRRYSSQLTGKCPSRKFSHILYMYYLGAYYTDIVVIDDHQCFWHQQQINAGDMCSGAPVGKFTASAMYTGGPIYRQCYGSGGAIYRRCHVHRWGNLRQCHMHQCAIYRRGRGNRW